MGRVAKSSKVEMSSLSVSPRVTLFPPRPRVILLLLLLAKSSLQASSGFFSDCEAPLLLEVVQSTSFNSDYYPGSSVLILGDEDARIDNQHEFNYWLAKREETTGQGFTMKVDSWISPGAPRWVGGVRIKNLRKATRDMTTREFRTSGATDLTGPWQTLLEGELVDTTGDEAASLLNFSFEKPIQIQYLRFELVSYWGTLGGGLQYFAPIPATTWTEWTGCCDKERRRMKTAVRDGECKVVSEVVGCTEDNCSDSGSASHIFNFSLLFVVLSLVKVFNALRE